MPKVSYAGTSGFDIYVGGLVGRIYRTGRISGCVNNGDVSAAAQASGRSMRRGVLGTFDRSDDAGDTAEVHSNTNNGTVTNSSDVKTLCVGGVMGRSSNGTCVIRDCINKGTVVSNSTAVNKVRPTVRISSAACRGRTAVRSRVVPTMATSARRRTTGRRVSAV